MDPDKQKGIFPMKHIVKVPLYSSKSRDIAEFVRSARLNSNSTMFADLTNSTLAVDLHKQGDVFTVYPKSDFARNTVVQSI